MFIVINETLYNINNIEKITELEPTPNNSHLEGSEIIIQMVSGVSHRERCNYKKLINEINNIQEK